MTDTSAWARHPTRAARGGLLAAVALVPVAAAFGALFAGRPGALGAALGGTVPVLVLALTWLAAEVGRRRSAQVFAGLLLGSYLVKLVAVGGLLAGLRQVDSADRTSLGLTAVVGLLLALIIESLVVIRAKAPYVEPVPYVAPDPPVAD